MTGAAIHHDHRPLPIRHDGSCGDRRQCWRPSCRKHWPDVLTVERLRNDMILAHCHGASYSGVGDFAWRVDHWRHGDSETWA